MLYGQVHHVLRNSEQKYKEAVVGDVLDPAIQHHPLERSHRRRKKLCEVLVGHV